MAKKFLVPIDHNNLESQNFLLQNLATDPTPKTGGKAYYNTATNRWMFANGSTYLDYTSRANHSGTQLASTISDFDTQVRLSRLDQMAAPTAAVSMNTQKITNLAAPTAGSNDAARIVDVENAVFAAASGIDSKASVRAVATSNITLSGTQTVDGVSLIAGDRILCRAQTTGSQNGVYIVAAGAWARATDADNASELTPGAFWFVEEGTTYGKSQWRIENTGAIVVGTTSISINQFGQQVSYVNGNGLTLTGNTFAVGQGTGIVVGATTVSIDTAVVARKYTQLIGDGSATSITVTHSLSNQYVTSTIFDAATNTEVDCDVVNTSATQTTFTFAAAPASNAYRVVITG